MTDNEKNMENEVENTAQAEVSSEPVNDAAVEPVVSEAESPLKNKKQLPDNVFMKVLLFIWAKLKQFGLAVWDGLKHIPYCCYCLTHPFEGFFRMKEDKRKQSMAATIILYALLAVSAIAKQQLTSYMFANVESQLNLDVLKMVFTTLLPYMLWVVSSWCFTSLMDGEGNLKDIFCATAVAAIPVIAVNIVLIPLSYLMTSDESNLYDFISALGTILMVAYMFLSMMSTQQYSVLKAIGTAILTVVGMAVIAFVVILFFYLIQQVWGFISSVFSEISYRLNE
mgnify:FL=1